KDSVKSSSRGDGSQVPLGHQANPSLRQTEHITVAKMVRERTSGEYSLSRRDQSGARFEHSDLYELPVPDRMSKLAQEIRVSDVTISKACGCAVTSRCRVLGNGSRYNT